MDHLEDYVKDWDFDTMLMGLFWLVVPAGSAFSIIYWSVR